MKKTNYSQHLCFLCALSFSAFSTAQVQPKHAKLNFSQQALSSDANPANTALVLDSNHSSLMFNGMVNFILNHRYIDIDSSVYIVLR